MTLRSHRLVISAFVLIAAFALVRASGQEPESTFVVGSCDVEPLSEEQLAIITSTPVASEATRTSVSGEFLIATGDPADEETTASATALVTQLVACNNEGNVASILAMGTDDFIRAYAQWLQPGVVVQAATPETFPVRPEHIALIEIDPVLTYRDGSAAAFARADLDPGSQELMIFVLVPDNDSWKIDAIVGDVVYQGGVDFEVDALPATPPATPTP
jgi:hypothetical protein